MPIHRHVTNAKLDRLARDASLARSRKTFDSAWLSGFAYDHGNLLSVDNKDRKDILFLCEGDGMKYNSARALHGCDPNTIIELVRGYKIAKDAGLLGTNAADRAPILPG